VKHGLKPSGIEKTALIGCVLLLAVSCASATEIESGYFQAGSPGTMSESLGFRPDYIEFITAQQVESVNTVDSPPTNSNCPQNVNGWSEGSVLFDSSGVEKQFSIGAFRNSDSTNDHRVASSTSHVIKNVYTGRNGGTCGELRVSVVEPLSGGFRVDIESTYDQYDEIVRYKAYQFPDNMEFGAGMVKISSEGSLDADSLGFQPANIHIRAGQQINGKNVDKQFTDNDPDTDNTLGRSKGYVTLDEDGSVIDQQSIGTASSSDSTNAHRSIASDQYVLNSAYVGQDGNLLDSSEPSRLRARVTGADSQGFNMQVDDKWSGTDEVFLYRAWGFSYYDFKIGYQVIPSGYVNWASGEPNDSGDEDCAEIYGDDNGRWNDIPCGDSHPGLCEYEDGTYDTTSSTSWSNAKSVCESRGGNLAVINDASENNYIQNNFGNVWIGYYQLDSGSEPAGKWRWVDQGRVDFQTGFKPDAIDIYAEQQIESINNEVTTPTNSGCDNAGGWSNGFYEADDNRQWALSTGRTSASQNSHRTGSTTSYGLMNLYSGQNGDSSNCGTFRGEVVSTTGSGFSMDFTTGEDFDQNYGREMVYYRAFNFRLAPPEVNSLDFSDSSDEHSFTATANISEGSNDVQECEFEAWSKYGNYHTFTNSSRKINSTHSQCIQTISYDDDADWESSHDSQNRLLNLSINVTAKDVDGQSSYETGWNTFPNHQPSVVDVTYSDYSDRHAFNVSAELSDLDAVNDEEIESCEFRFSDGDGNSFTHSVPIDYGFGTENQALCLYSDINSSITGFEVLEDIDVEVTVEDYHSVQSTYTGSHKIPNSEPFSLNPEPQDEGYTGSYPVDLSVTVDDPEMDMMNVTFFNADNGNQIYREESLTVGERPGHEWDVPDATTSTHRWTVQVSDKWSARNITYEFTNSLETNYRSDLSVELNYSTIVMEEGNNRYTELTIHNRVSNEKNLTINLTGVEAEFLDGSSVKTLPEFGGGESRAYTIRATPDTVVDGNITVTVTNNDLGIETVERIPVTVLPSSIESNEVPGIGAIQLIFLLSAATVLYSVRL
jgi:hypothetical protein